MSKGNDKENISIFYLLNNFKYTIICSVFFVFIIIIKIFEIGKRKNDASSKISASKNDSIFQTRNLRKKRNEKKKKENNILKNGLEEGKEEDNDDTSFQTVQSLEEKDQNYHFHQKNKNFLKSQKIKNLKNINENEKEINGKFGYTKFNLYFKKEDSLESGSVENKNTEKEIPEINLIDEKELKKDLKEKQDLLNEMKFNLLDLIIFIKDLETKINEKLRIESEDYLKNQIKSNIFKMSNAFRFLNNIRLILFSRKIVNKIIQNEVKNNEKIHISKTVFLNDLSGFNYKNDEQKLKLYVSAFIVQIGDGKLSQNNYNLVLDFLYYLKNYLNNSVHLVNKIEEFTTSKQFYLMFYYNNEKEKNEINIKNINPNSIKIEYKNENLKNMNEISIMIKNKNFIFGLDNINNGNSNKKTTKIEDINIAINNTLNLKKDIENLNNYILYNDLKSHLTKEYENNNFEEESIHNFSYSFSLHDLEDDSINNLKKVFVNFFSQNENGNTNNKSLSKILEEEKKKIRSEYLKIIKKLMLSENIINNIDESYITFEQKNKILIEKLKRYKERIKDNINTIRKWLNDNYDIVSKYYDLLLLSTLFKIKVEVWKKSLLMMKTFFLLKKYFKNGKRILMKNILEK